MAANTNYRFKTIMVSDFVREEFTQFRDQLDGVRVTDKELSALAWALVDKEQLLSTMKALKASQERVKELSRIERLEAKGRLMLRERRSKGSAALLFVSAICFFNRRALGRQGEHDDL